MTSKSRLLSSVVNKPESLIGASLSQPNEVNLQALETAATQYTDVTTLPASGYAGEQAFVASTNRLYIWTGTGWFNIALVNTDPTISSAGAANYTMSYGTPITVNVDASDPEGLGLSYSYYTSDSIGSIATISQDSSQFTITPSSDYSVEGSFGLVFRASDGPNIASSSSSTFTLTNQSPSLSGNSSSYVLATDGSTPTVITLTSVDPEGQPITYTATGDSGFNAIATVSNDSSVFTIIPKSEDSAVSGTGSLTFTASDGVKSTNATSSFTINFISIIENSKYTTLLATATNTSDNNNITDASTNNHTITVTGDANAGTFSPYRSGGYAMSLNGIDESFEPNHSSASGLGTTWSISFWANIPSTGVTNNYPLIFDIDYNSSNGILIQANLAFKNFSVSVEGAGSIINTAYPLTCFDKWSYYVLTHSSGTTTFYIDGSSVGSSTNSSMSSIPAANVQQLVIGGDRYDQSSKYPKMDIRDFHVRSEAHNGAINNEAAVADGNTVILAAHKPYLAAQTGASTALAPIINNSVSTKPFSPYDYEEYSAADHGGSVYLDGNTDTIHTASTHNFANNGFSVSFWYYPTLAQGVLFASASNHIGTMHFSGSLSSSEIRYEYKNSSGSNTNLIGNNAAKPIYFSWNYLQIVQDSNGHIRIYSNGTQVGSTVTNAAMSGASSTAVTLGAWGSSGSSSGFQGYISDFNLTTETSPSTAVPIAPRSSTSNTKLLISGTDASIIDKAQGSNLNLFGNTTGSTTQAKFVGSKSMYFDGSGDGILCKGTQIPTGATESWTIEAWAYVTDTSTERQIFAQYSAGSSSTRFVFGVESAKFRVFNGGTSLYSLNAVSLNTWTHVAVTYNGSAAELYVDGISQGTLTLNRGVDDVDLQIGARNQGATQPWVGYIQDARVTKGLARYTANFTPPTASLES